MLCVSEYLPNGNLEVAIRKDRERKDGKPRLLGWYMQGRPIAVDVARGLAFLHTHKARAPGYPTPCWARCIGPSLQHITPQCMCHADVFSPPSSTLSQHQGMSGVGDFSETQ